MHALSAVIAFHIAFALGALALGAYVLYGTKGTAKHRLFGRIWVLSLTLVAITSFWIQTSGRFSWIHLLSVLTLANLSYAIVQVRRGKVHAHQRAMKNQYFYGLLLPGLLTLLPGRLLNGVVMNFFKNTLGF
jgi:uncharacterized membrane protein